jgi:iron(II)-dependent oxidoreductase
VPQRCIERLAGHENQREPFYQLALFRGDMHSEPHPHPSTLGARPSLSLPDVPPQAGAPDSQFEPHDVEIPGGSYCLGGTADMPFVFDNEKWAHPVSVAPYRIAAAPVTTADFMRFVEQAGYQGASIGAMRGGNGACGPARSIRLSGSATASNGSAGASTGWPRSKRCSR